MSERVKRWTPGPWCTGYQGGLSGDVISWQCFLDDVDCKQLPISCQGKAVAVINYSQDSNTHKADAALIAAAPALVEALEAFVNNSSAQANMPSECEQAEAVLSMAYGETQ